MQGKSMLRALCLGAAMSLGSALSGAKTLRALPQMQTANAGRGKGKGKGRARQVKSWSGTRTSSSSKTRSPADPAQAYLIARAEAKRSRRAVKLQRDSVNSFGRNPAHCSDSNYHSEKISRFNPFYVAQ